MSRNQTHNTGKEKKLKRIRRNNRPDKFSETLHRRTSVRWIMPHQELDDYFFELAARWPYCPDSGQHLQFIP